jgi:hypothetical protein
MLVHWILMVGIKALKPIEKESARLEYVVSL